MLQAQIIDEQGQYVDTVFHDHINRQAEDFVRVSLVVAEPGDYLYTSLGHAAYHMVCPTFGLDYYYTMESENTPNRVMVFLAGKLKMGFIPLTPEQFLSDYKEQNRGIKEWALNLSPQQEQRLWQILENHTKTDQDLPYDYYHRSCAIVLVNLMNEVLGAENIHYQQPWSDKFKQTPREFVATNLTNPWTALFMDIIAGWDVDWDVPNERKLIIPTDVVETWQTATIDGRPLLDTLAIEILPPGHRVEQTQCTPLLLSIILLILSVLSLGTVWSKSKGMRLAGTCIDWLIIVLQMAIGIFISYLLFVSNLCCTGWHWYYIAVCPLPLLLWHWRKYWLLPYLIMLSIWVLVMIFYPHLIVISPLIILTIAWMVVLVKQWLLENRILTKKN